MNGYRKEVAHPPLTLLVLLQRCAKCGVPNRRPIANSRVLTFIRLCLDKSQLVLTYRGSGAEQLEVGVRDQQMQPGGAAAGPVQQHALAEAPAAGRARARALARLRNAGQRPARADLHNVQWSENSNKTATHFLM